MSYLVFLASAGRASKHNAKKVVEVELRSKGTDLHAATGVGDTIGDPLDDTSSVAMNPLVKFTTLAGLALGLQREARLAFAGLFIAGALLFVWRSFYRMRIGTRARRLAAALPPRAVSEHG